MNLYFHLLFVVALFFTCIYTMMSWSIYRQDSTAQHRAISPPAQSGKASMCRSERENASRQNCESQHVVEQLYSSLCYQNERRNQHLLGLQNILSTHKAM